MRADFNDDDDGDGDDDSTTTSVVVGVVVGVCASLLIGVGILTYKRRQTTAEDAGRYMSESESGVDGGDSQL